MTYTVCVNKDEETALSSVNTTAFVAISDACQRVSSNLTPVKSKKSMQMYEIGAPFQFFDFFRSIRLHFHYQMNTRRTIQSQMHMHEADRYLSILKCKSDR